MTTALSNYSPDSIVGRAFSFATQAHKDVVRASGDPYITHSIDVAETVRAWHLDDVSIAAALLHDVVEDTRYALDDIRKLFGDETASLVDGLTKLKNLQYPKDPQVENLRKFIVSFSKDLRILIIKLADRLHNMQTLKALPPEDQHRIAWETTEIYAPLAYRLGMQKLSGELEDLAFPFIHPEEHRWLLKTVKEPYEERLRYALKLEPVVRTELERHHIKSLAIDSRAKRYSSLYKKIIRHSMDLSTIYDLVALRVIVENVEECYAALGVIHQLWPPLPNRFKDYIARPKLNGYRSLHTTVFCINHKITEFQIRTQEMHEENELGIAAHWAYQQIKSSAHHTMNWRGVTSRRELIWVEQLQNWQKNFTDHKEFIKSLKIDFFKDRIFVVTPQNDVIDLPAGATPVDFAYQIHSDIGDTCTGAKVNQKIVPLDYELHSGDVVEILTQRGKKPSEGWLEFIKTTLARRHVKSAVRKKDRSLEKRVAPLGFEFKVTNFDRPGYLKDVTSAFAREKINMTFLQSQTDARGTLSLVTIRSEPLVNDKLERLLVQLKKIPGTREVRYTRTR